MAMTITVNTSNASNAPVATPNGPITWGETDDDPRLTTVADFEAAHAEAIAEDLARFQDATPVKRRRRTTEEKAEADRKTAFRRRARAMTDADRTARLEKYPNPETMDIRQFLADCDRERQEHGWCGEARSYVNSITFPHVLPSGVRTSHRLLAEHPQWDAEKNEYNEWAINPRLPEGVREVPTTVVLAKVSEILRRYNDGNFRYGMENILSAQGVTYVDMAPSYKVTADFTITPEMITRSGYTLAGLSEYDRNYYLSAIIRQRIRDDFNATLNIEEITPNGANPARQ